MQPTRLLEDRVVLFAPRFIHPVVAIVANHRLVRRNDRDFELVDLVELVLLCLRGTRHPRELLIHPEVILNGDGRHGLRLTLHVNAFLGFDRLMQPVAPTAARHFASGEFIDDNDFVIFDHVLHVFLEQAVGAEQLRDVVDPLRLRVAMLLALGFFLVLLFVG